MLAMHSARELCCAADPTHLARALTAFLGSGPAPAQLDPTSLVIRARIHLRSGSDQETSARNGGRPSGMAARSRIRRQWA